MRRFRIAQHKGHADQLFVAEGLSAGEASSFSDDVGTHPSRQYRLVLNCQSDKNGVRGHRKVTVSYKAG